MGIFDKLIRAFKPNLREKQNKFMGKNFTEEEKVQLILKKSW